MLKENQRKRTERILVQVMMSKRRRKTQRFEQKMNNYR